MGIYIYQKLPLRNFGGIHANNVYRGQFLYENLMIEFNVIHQSYENGVKKLLFLGSSCIYPKFAEQPIQEDSLLTGILEQTNEPYAIAKIAGIKLCETYRPQFDEINQHVSMPMAKLGLLKSYSILSLGFFGRKL